MTLDKSLKVKRGANRNRSVMTRVERLAAAQGSRSLEGRRFAAGPAEGPRPQDDDQEEEKEEGRRGRCRRRRCAAAPCRRRCRQPRCRQAGCASPPRNRPQNPRQAACEEVSCRFVAGLAEADDDCYFGHIGATWGPFARGRRGTDRARSANASSSLSWSIGIHDRHRRQEVVPTRASSMRSTSCSHWVICPARRRLWATVSHSSIAVRKCT